MLVLLAVSNNLRHFNHSTLFLLNLRSNPMAGKIYVFVFLQFKGCD